MEDMLRDQRNGIQESDEERAAMKVEHPDDSNDKLPASLEAMSKGYGVAV